MHKDRNSVSSMESIIQLFGELCDAHMTCLEWKVCLGRPNVCKSRAKQQLKRVAYNTLFMNLFQDAARSLPSNMTKLPIKNKILMLSFNLRMSGRGTEADRLEELVEQLEKCACLPFAETNAVLELLVELAGTGLPQLVPQKRDYFLNNKYVGRNLKYQGYDYYDVTVFEAGLRSVIANEECQINDTIQRTLKIMEAAPGTGLPTIGYFSQNYLANERFEKETRVSLFGALVHSRTHDMDIKLDLPPVPDNADLSGLAIKVPQSIDPSEDEGFQSASNLTPDSQSEPNMTPDIDLWDVALTHGTSKRRCWERIGCPPGKKEEPYLTEAGREAFDKFYRLREGEVQMLSSTSVQLPQLVLLKESDLVKDVLNALIGVVSSTFPFNQSLQAFVVKQGIYVLGTSPENMSNLLSQFAEHGTYYTRLSRFSVQPVLDASYSKGLVFQAFTSGLRKYLQYYRACVLSTPPTLTLLALSFLFRRLGRQLRYLAELCGIGATVAGTNRGSGASFPTGVKLLSYLYKEALDNCSNEHYAVLLSLLKTSCEPYTRFVYDWVYSGFFKDAYGEFMIQVNEDYLHFRDKRYWTQGYILASKEVEDFVPVFLKHIANEIYICGKTINLLKLCCPKHYICWSDIPVPRISVTFSLEELKEMEKDCAVYMGRMERIARYSAISKEEKHLRMEIAKQELIIQAHESATKVMETFKDHKKSEKMALEAKKRECFQKLKEQFVKDQERRLAAKQEEIHDDFSYARELREREKRLTALEEELEKKARQEMIEHYSKLSEEAARKEQKALWKIQRHKLETARISFLIADEKHIQELLEEFPKSGYREKLDVLPRLDKQGIITSVNTVGDASSQAQSPETSSADTCVYREETESGLKSVPHTDISLKLVPSESAVQAGVDTGSPSYSTSQSPPSNLCLLDVSIEDFLPKLSQDEECITTSFQNSAVENALQDIDSDLSRVPEISECQPVLQGVNQEGIATESCQQDEYDFKTVLRPSGISQVSQGHIRVGENVSEVQSTRPRWNIHGHASTANIKIGEYVPDTKVLQPQSSQYGHSSDSHIKLGEYSSDVEPSRPRWNLHGHISTSHIKVGEYASNVEPSRPRWNIHGNASQSNIKIGENVSEVEPPRPRWNIHGHASDANIKIGENVSDIESSRPRWNIHGHASQSHIKIGELVSDVETSKPRWNPFGHVSQSSIKIGDWTPSVEMDPKLHLKTSSCSWSVSTVQNLLYADKLAPLVETTRDSKAAEHMEEPLPSVHSDSTADCLLSSLHETKEQEDKSVPTSAESKDTSSHHCQPLQIDGPEQNILEESLLPCFKHPAESIDPERISSGTEGKTEGDGESDVWNKEQAYVKTLSEKYCLEKYQDNYDLMSEPPVLHLLHHVMPRPLAFTGHSHLQSATDVTAVQLIELLSLPVLMKYSVTAPLVSHVSLVNKAIVDYYVVELKMEKHFEALRHFLLMEDGEFAQSLSDLLFDKLGLGQTPGELLNPLVLNSILNKALQYSLHGDSQLASNLSFALRYLPEVFKPNAPDALSCLELRYKVDWPLNIVITESCMNKYSKIFSFLLQLKHMVWTLKDVWFHLKRSALVNRASNAVQFRQLQLYRHEMQHFVKVIQGYIANQILHVTWCEFRNKLSSVGNLEEIHRTHADYLNKALFRGLLTEKATPVMNIIHSIFSLILKFRIQLISQSWSCDAGQQMAVHPNFTVMQQSYNTFKYYSDFLFEVVTKLVNRGYQPHLEDFLLRINFNNYYKDS
ncbi:gamma-tubulin complex component 6 [Rhinatrema bivittatum]|uniref:gamma-tubulin complex component 6 n=1 Tax=Rhinatrema bivittatum TaxID=194408 RepID=UPI0011298036|nr:gamma-tubulin complex component 6 [Rhinatrema bivittatum]XP_029473253.1 gamma-tubulin complex component 6 [Rhinatrema bivittatum]